MLGRAMRNAALVAVLAFAVPAAVQAQATIYAGGGVATGVGDTGDATDAGWLALAGVVVGVGEGGIGIGAEGLYGSLSGADSGPAPSGSEPVTDVSCPESSYA